MKKLDFLSPPITLFHLERRTHTSRIGGILVILMSAIYLAYITYLLFKLISHGKITSIFYQRFQFEAGYYSFNSSSIFHFLQIYSTENKGQFNKFESKFIRAYITYPQTNISYLNLELYEHWLFDSCENGVDNKNFDSELFEHIVNFTNAVCIKYYYNNSEKKYYSFNDEGFIWPHLEHGLSHRENIYLTTSVLKCKNNSVVNSILGNCSSQEEIDKYVNKINFLYLYFTNTQIDPTNYHIPIQHYFQTVTTIIGNEKTFIESFIHFSPIKLKTNEGSLFGKTYEYNSYCYDYDRKGSADNDNNLFMLSKYYHLLQNNVQIYERRYDNIFDLLSEIGGVVQSIFYAFFWLNYIYNKYIIAYDTNSLFFAVKENNVNKSKKIKKLDDNSNKNENNQNKENNKLKKPLKKFESVKNYIKPKNEKFLFNNNINSPSKNNDSFSKENKKSYRINSINFDRSINFKTFYQNSNKINNEQNSSYSILKENNSIFINNNKKNLANIENNKLNINLTKNDKIKKAYTGFMKKDEINKFWLTRESLAKIEHSQKKLNDIFEKDNKRKIRKITFFKFLKDIIFENTRGSNYFLIKFRKHLLSEEHLFKSHVQTVLLEKQCKLNNNNNNTTNVYECFNEL